MFKGLSIGFICTWILIEVPIGFEDIVSGFGYVLHDGLEWLRLIVLISLGLGLLVHMTLLFLLPFLNH